MNLKLFYLLPQDIIDYIYSKIIYNQPKELLLDIKNYKLCKNRINHLSDTNIITNLYNINNNNIKIPRTPKYVLSDKFVKDYLNNRKLMINLYLAKNNINIRNHIVYLLTF